MPFVSLDRQDQKSKRTLRGLDRSVASTTFVSSWYLSGIESAALWRLFPKSDEGIAIKSTVERLGKSIAEGYEEYTVSMGSVTYGHGRARERKVNGPRSFSSDDAVFTKRACVDWLLIDDVLTALLTPTLAVFAIIPYKSNRTRSLQATADKRQSVFAAVMTLVSYLVVEGKNDHLDVHGIQERAAGGIGAVLGSACVFAPEDRLRILEFNRKAYRISALVAQTKGAHNEEIDSLLKWFEHEYDSVTNAVSENKTLGHREKSATH